MTFGATFAGGFTGDFAGGFAAVFTGAFLAAAEGFVTMGLSLFQSSRTPSGRPSRVAGL